MSNFWGAHQQLAIAYAEVLYMAQNGDLCTRWPGARSGQGVRRRVHTPDTGEATETATFERKPKTERKNTKKRKNRHRDI